MPSYLLQLSYTAEAWAAMIETPQDRVKAVSKVVEKLGGKIEGFWGSFGDYDLVGVVKMPDNVAAAAFAVSIAGGGACKAVKTTPLISISDAVDAMKKAGKSGYKPVTKK